MPTLFADTDIVIVAALAFVATLLAVESLLLRGWGNPRKEAPRL